MLGGVVPSKSLDIKFLQTYVVFTAINENGYHKVLYIGEVIYFVIAIKKGNLYKQTQNLKMHITLLVLVLYAFL